MLDLTNFGAAITADAPAAAESESDQCADRRAGPGERPGIAEVDLVEDDDVGELHLVGEQVDDGAVVGLVARLAALGQRLEGVPVTQERGAVDDGHHRVEACDVFQRAPVLEGEGEGEGLGDGHRLGDPGRLDQQVVEPVLGRESGDLLEEILAQGAADAAVAHLDDALFDVVDLRGAEHVVGVDVDLAHVVDDHRHAAPVAVVQHVLEQCRLPGPEEAGQHGDRQAAIGGHAGHQTRSPRARISATTRSMPRASMTF